VQVSAEPQERYWYPEDGGQVWVAGYQLVGRDGRYLARDAPELAEAGLRVAHVAGAGRHHADALQSGQAAPGSALVLRRDPGNEHDANAIEVRTRQGEALGFVPRELAAELAPQLDRGTLWSAVVLREQRESPRDPRTGITMLLAQGETLRLVLPAPRD
jgi:HIRAN domain